MPAAKYTILPGRKFGRLTVLEEGPRWKYPSSKPLRAYLCRCVCGREKLVTRNSLVTGHTRSCGCLNDETRRALIGTIATIHGEARTGKQTPEYRAWLSMRRRCLSPKATGYQRYGGRGITVCDRWTSSFQNFLEDVGRKPGKQYSLERVNNDGPYSPENCKWATKSEQSANTRRSMRITFNGETLTLRQWAFRIGLPYNTLKSRIKWFRWPIEKALTTPSLKRDGSGRLME